LTIFDRATDYLREKIGIGKSYAAQHSCGVYVVEAHVWYQGEIKVADHVRIDTSVLAAAGKKMHIVHQMHRMPDNQPAAGAEMILVHVDRNTGRGTLFPDGALQLLGAMAIADRHLNLPRFVGRVVRI